MTAAVTLSDLHRTFGRVTALDGLTWTAPRGRITAVLGPNGAGKTTAIECAVGLGRPDAGTVRVLGTDPWLADADHRAASASCCSRAACPTARSRCACSTTSR